MDPFAAIETLHQAYAAGVSTREVVEEALARIEAYSSLRAYITVTPDLARARADVIDARRRAGAPARALEGVPVGIKDLVATRGIRTTCGSGARRDWIPDDDAAIVTRLHEAGAVSLGKLHTTEFAYVGYHPEMEPPLNPWSADHWPGLSSSGSGVAVAAGLCTAAIGTDTGGSIRFPSSACGVVGLKPTYDAISRAGVTELVGSLDHVGPMTRSVADAARMFEVLSGQTLQQPRTSIRVGIDERFNREGVHEATRRGLELAAERFQAMGAECVDVRFPALDAALDAYNVIFCFECAAAHADSFARRSHDYGPVLRAHMRYMQRATEASYEQAQRIREVFCTQMDAVFARADVLLLPALDGPPPPLGDRSNEIELSSPSARFSIPFNLTGQPTLTIPCGLTQDRLPVALQLAARADDESTLLHWGQKLESEDGFGFQTSSS